MVGGEAEKTYHAIQPPWRRGAASSRRPRQYNWWMLLLVSVRDATEAHAALQGGADIIDAKEPANGPLAPVSAATLQSICASVPPGVPISVALGDALPAELDELVASVAFVGSRSAVYFKAAVASDLPDEAAGGIAAACRRLERRADRPEFVVARYVDQPGDADHLSRWVEVCADAGARGLLLDTSRKHGDGLFGSIEPKALAELGSRAAKRGIWLAIAGGVTTAHLEQIGVVQPDVLGVRGAVCEGGRKGVLSGARVAALRQAMDGITPRNRLRALPV